LFADYVDIDYDTISGAVSITTEWSRASGKSGWSETITPVDGSDQVEVGVLHSQKAEELEELSLGGYLTVIGQDAKPGKTALIKGHVPLC